MSKITRFAIATVLIALTGSAQALIIDFKAAGEPGGLYGESAWNPFKLLTGFGIDVDIYGVKDGSSAYVYLDSNNGGMGVCGDLNSFGSAHLNSATNSNTNSCNPPSDDNATTGESLEFMFNEAVVIEKIWFNNNHDSDRRLIGDTISIFGDSYTFGATDEDSNRYIDRNSVRYNEVVYNGGNSFAAGSTGRISFENEQFYLSAMEIYSVPEPATLALVGLGLFGLSLKGRGKSQQ